MIRLSHRCVSITLLTAVALSQAPSGGADEKTAPPTLRVGTWNIEWLGKADRRHNMLPQRPEDLAQYIDACGVDVLALNEVSWTGDGDDPRTNKTLAAALELLRKQTGSEWRHVLFPKEDREDRDQLTGVAWNTRKARLVGRELRVPVRRGPVTAEIFPRHPYAVKFSAGDRKTDLVLIPVHMKSNRGGEDVTSKQRSEEAKALVRSLAAVQNHFADDDVVVLGDSNCKAKTESALARFALGGLRDLNGGDEPTWIKSASFDAAPFDRVFVPDDQPEFADSKLTVRKQHHLGAEAEFRKKLSDHYMVTADVKVLDDDD